MREDLTAVLKSLIAKPSLSLEKRLRARNNTVIMDSYR